MSSQDEKTPSKRYETALGVGVLITGIFLVLILQNTPYQDPNNKDVPRKKRHAPVYMGWRT